MTLPKHLWNGKCSYYIPICSVIHYYTSILLYCLRVATFIPFLEWERRWAEICETLKTYLRSYTTLLWTSFYVQSVVKLNCGTTNIFRCLITLYLFRIICKKVEFWCKFYMLSCVWYLWAILYAEPIFICHLRKQ